MCKYLYICVLVYIFSAHNSRVGRVSGFSSVHIRIDMCWCVGVGGSVGGGVGVLVCWC